MNITSQALKELFERADKIGKKQYHKLTHQDFENYRKYDDWRYINGDSEYGTTQDSTDWVRDHSDWYCPICGENYSKKGGKTIDHKLPRSQYPWLSMEFKNFWVICKVCNNEKGEMHWYEYEHYMFIHYPDLYLAVKAARPSQLLQRIAYPVSWVDTRKPSIHFRPISTPNSISSPTPHSARKNRAR